MNSWLERMDCEHLPISFDLTAAAAAAAAVTAGEVPPTAEHSESSRKNLSVLTLELRPEQYRC